MTQYNLYPHQEDGIEYLESRLEKGLGGALLMEPRLGKSLTFLRFYERNIDKFQEGIILCAPLIVCNTWLNTLIEDSDEYCHLDISDALELSRQEVLDKLGICAIYKGTKLQKEKAYARSLELGHKIFIVTHASLRLIPWTHKPSALVVDESTILANPKNSFTKHAMKFEADYKYILNGAPAPESKYQLFMQFKFIQPNFCGFNSYWTFLSNCFMEFGFKLVIKKSWEAKIINAAATDGFVRTMKELNLGNKKLYSVIEVPMSKDQRKLYNDMLEYAECDGMVADHEMTKALYLQRICGGYTLNEITKEPKFISSAKIDVILELMNSELKDKPVIIWCKFISEIHQVTQSLTDAGYRGYKGWGGTKSDNDDKARLLFNGGKLDFMVLQIKKFNAGINLAGADNMIYYSNEWSSNLRTQSEERCSTVSKTTPTMIYDLCCEHSIDHNVVKALKEKDVDAKKLMSEARFKYMGVKK